jgi:hypothetical protein
MLPKSIRGTGFGDAGGSTRWRQGRRHGCPLSPGRPNLRTQRRAGRSRHAPGAIAMFRSEVLATCWSNCGRLSEIAQLRSDAPEKQGSAMGLFAKCHYINGGYQCWAQQWNSSSCEHSQASSLSLSWQSLRSRWRAHRCALELHVAPVLLSRLRFLLS